MAGRQSLLLCCGFLLVLLIPYGVCESRRAICNLMPDTASAQSVTGVINFSQASALSSLTISLDIRGLKAVPAGSEASLFDHGFHVHEFGNLTDGCSSTGGHYNPFGQNHGAPTNAIRHVGDFGNIAQSPAGTIQLTFDDPIASLYGEQSIIGRAMVVHAKQDDLGFGGNPSSLANGNAGARLGCCVIGWAN